MTISTELRKAGPFTGNGVTTAFPFSFKVFAATDVTVTVANTQGNESVLALGADYAVALNADQDAAPGGTVTLAAPLSTGYRLVVSSAVPNLQPTGITNNGGFSPRVIEDALDRQVAQIQQIAEQAARAVKVKVTDTTDPDQLVADLIADAESARTAAAGAASSEANAAASAASASSSESNAAASQSAAASSAGAASTSATNAAASASSASASAANAAASQSAAASSEASAQASATTASTKASEAAASAAAAAAAASNAEIAFDSFDDKYLGSKASDPATDNDGNALLTGALYWNTSVGAVRVWNGSDWLSMAADASIVDFQQAGAGAVVRTAQDKMREWVSVEDFGAVGDYVPTTGVGTDDTAAIQAALDAVKALGGGALFVPAGIYKISAALNYSDAPLAIVGQGIDNSMIVQVTAGANAFNFTSTITTNRVDAGAGHGGRSVSLSLEGLCIATPVVAGTAVRMNMQDYSANCRLLTVRDVEVTSLLNTLAGFTRGIHGTDLNGTIIDGYRFMGDAGNQNNAGAFPYSSQTAIELDGAGSEGNICHLWSRLILDNCNRAVKISSWYEGLYCDKFEFVAVGVGAEISGSPSRDNYVTHFVNGHVDFKSSAFLLNYIWQPRLIGLDMIKSGGPVVLTIASDLVVINNSHHGKIIGCDLHSMHDAAIENALVLASCADFTVSGNNFYDIEEYAVLASNSVGVSVTGNQVREVADGVLFYGTTSDGLISGNEFRNFSGAGNGFCAVLEATTSRNLVDGNVAGGTNINLVVANASAANKVGDNFGPGTAVGQFASGDTSPDVGATGAGMYMTANAGATTIQTFDNAHVGKELTVIAGDANTTIENAAAVGVPIFLKGAANKLLATNESIRFQRANSAWYEI